MTHKILSVRQPWAGLLVSGVKRYEERSWKPNLAPGWIVIHASGSNAVGLRDLLKSPVLNEALSIADMDDQTQWDHSAVLGAVRVSAFLDTWEDTQRPRRLTEIDQELIGDPPDRFLWKITEARRLRHPIPCDGYLKIWEPDRTLAIAIGRAEIGRASCRGSAER